MLNVNLLFIQFLNSLVHAHNNNNKIFVFKTNQLICNFCSFLKNKGLIFSYSIHTFNNNKYITVFFKYYRNTPMFRNILAFSRKNSKQILSNKDIARLFFKTQGLFVISTTKGILLMPDAYYQGLGGILLAKILLF